MAEENAAELKKQLAAKTAECAALKEQVEELKEKLERGVDCVKDKLGQLTCGSDDAEDAGSKAPGEEKPPAEAATDVAKKALGSFF